MTERCERCGAMVVQDVDRVVCVHGHTIRWYGFETRLPNDDERDNRRHMAKLLSEVRESLTPLQLGEAKEFTCRVCGTKEWRPTKSAGRASLCRECSRSFTLAEERLAVHRGPAKFLTHCKYCGKPIVQNRFGTRVRCLECKRIHDNERTKARWQRLAAERKALREQTL